METIPLTKASVEEIVWGNTAERLPVQMFTLTSTEIEVRAISYGARLVSIRTPDRDGRMADVILGYDSLHEYLEDKRTHQGTVVGRFGNRIAHGTFSIDGEIYQIPLNNGPNALHGGPVGFDKQVWHGQAIPGGVEFMLISPDGDMGFPGTLTAKVRYTLEGSTLRIEYFATTDKPTVVNLTNHAYFNLSGDQREDILDKEITINADRYIPVNADMIPTGELADVTGTPFDLRRKTRVGARIEEPDQQLLFAGGYDHNFILNGEPGEMKLAARVHSCSSGRVLSVMTTEPGLQFYSGNRLEGTFTGRHGKPLLKHSGLCLETQHFPDSPNQPSFPTTLLRPDGLIHSTSTFEFTIQN